MMRVHRSLAVPLLIVLFALAALPAGAQATAPAATVAGAIVNLRAGPDTTFRVIAQATRGTVLTVNGRNAANSWWYVCCVNDRAGWVYGTLVVIEGSTADVPIVAATSQPAPAPPDAWRGEYFANPSLSGTAAHMRADPQVAFRWGGASPAPGVPGSNFSVRWSRTVYLEAGDYQFDARVDDGVRLYVDAIAVLDAWQPGSARNISNTLRKVGAGNHRITVEYFQAAGDALISVSWQKADAYPDWKGEYFNDIYLLPPALLVRNDPRLDFSWSLDAPDPRIPADNFSVRWSRTVNFAAGSYEFLARSSDGIRLYLDDWLVINEWHDTVGDPTYLGRFYDLGPGNHRIVVEYYERGGLAYAQVRWQSMGGGTPQ